MKYTKQQIIEYAQLAQQCYYISNTNNEPPLPANWKVIFFEQGTWDTFYVLYVNSVRKEVILGIRGTDKEHNWLVNASLALGALTDRHELPPGANEVEDIAKDIVFNLDISFEESNKLNQMMKSFNQKYVSPINKSFLSSIYITTDKAKLNVAKSSSSSSVEHDNSVTLAGVKDVYDKSVKQLKSLDSRESVRELGNELVNFTQNRYPSFTFKIVGHSLGGYIAEICAVSIGIECVTFESPGTLGILEELPQFKNKPRNITNFLSAPNIINTLNHHSGAVYRLKLPHTNDAFSWMHGASCVMRISSLACVYSLGAVGIATLDAAAGGMIIEGIGTVTKKIGLSVASTKLAGGAVGLWSNIEWLKRQHSIDNIVVCLQRDGIQLAKMASWPRTNWKDLTSWLKEFFRDFVPFLKDKPGIRNLADEEGMREAQISRMPGYKEENINVLLLLDINKMKEEAEEWKFRKQWLEQELRKYEECQEELRKLSLNDNEYQTNIEIPPK